MNRKLNTLLFVLGASLINIVIMLLLLGAALLLLSFVPAQNMPRWSTRILGLLPLPLAVAGAFFFYHRVMGMLMRNIDMDRYFEPLFSLGKRKKNQ